MSLFLTGATGFLGRHLLARLEPARHGPVRCLVRDPAQLKRLATGDVEAVTGDLLRPETYRDALRAQDTVVHLAALTGKGDDRTHFRINAEGTELLLNAAREAGVRRFLST